MNKTFPRYEQLLFPVILTLAAGLPGCGSENGQRVDNAPPSVRITGGPASGTEESYTARIFWTGWDEDGVVEHYEYAQDPPDSCFTDDEINFPEDYGNITIRVIPGPDQARDTLVVCKDVGEAEPCCFRWVQTTDFNRSFEFQTPEPRIGVGGISTRIFTGVHTVYVRCQDDRGTYSEVDRIGYTARTITPDSQIRLPVPSPEPMNLGLTLTVHWDGFDPDASSPQKKPTGYLYKLLRVDTLDPPLPLTSIRTPEVLYDQPGPWILQDADTLSQTFFLPANGRFVFGVRAVDQAGAAEPFLEFGRNAFKFQALAGGGRPTLNVFESSLGSETFRGEGVIWEGLEAAVGARLRFNWQGNADGYGGKIEAYSWGVDIPDLEQEGPDSGWSPWGPTTSSAPISFANPGIHVVYIRVRDVAGAISLATIVVNFLDFPLDREVLVVDDYRDQTFPTDVQHDAFWQRMFKGYTDHAPDYALSDFAVFNAWGPTERSTNPISVRLSELARYKLIIWDNLGTGIGGSTSLFTSAVRNPFLGAYLNAGGKLWVTGSLNVAALTPSTTGTGAEFIYPKSMRPNDFPYEFLKIRSIVDNNQGLDARESLVGALPFPGFGDCGPEVPPEECRAPYDTLWVDKGKLNAVQGREGGWRLTDAIFDPNFVESTAGFRGNVDSLYVSAAAGVWDRPPYFIPGAFVPPRGAQHNNRLIAVRWSDPDPDRRHGRTQWFGFPFYYVRDELAQETFNRSLDWFREETRPAP